jgi:hypothetical protein
MMKEIRITGYLWRQALTGEHVKGYLKYSVSRSKW